MKSYHPWPGKVIVKVLFENKSYKSRCTELLLTTVMN